MGHLAWSPSGETIAVAGEEAVWVVQPDGSSVPIVSPSATDFVFVDEGHLIVADRVLRFIPIDEPAAEIAWSFTNGYGVDVVALAPDGRAVAVLRQWEDADRIEIISLPSR